MQIKETEVKDVFTISPSKFEDERGFFSEFYKIDFQNKINLKKPFIQENLSYSKGKYVLRGLHCQSPPYAQAKLIRVLRGCIIDFIIDIREGSPTYHKIFTIELSVENNTQLFVPEGFLHGFITLTDDCLVSYLINSIYKKEHEVTVTPFEEIDLTFPCKKEEMTMSSKDKEGIKLSQLANIFKKDEEWNKALSS